MAQTAPPESRRSTPEPIRRRGTKLPFFVEFYRSAIGKKWVMALTGLALMGFVLFHLVGNLKLYLSKEEINLYGEALRDLGGHLVPHSSLLWGLRLGLIAAFALHIHAAYSLTLLNRRARPESYASPRDYAAADFASRSMRWTGVIVGLYVVFHLMDLTWGNANPEFLRGDPYNNLVYSLQRVPVAIVYVIANVALGIHLLHGTWSLFQSLGWNNPRFNAWRRNISVGFVAVVLVGNLSFPILIQAGVVDLECPNAPPELSCREAGDLGVLEETAR